MAVPPSLDEVLGAVPGHLKHKLDQILDSGHEDVPLHLGNIADNIPDWQGRVADNLGLTRVEVSDIKRRLKDEPELQRSVCSSTLTSTFLDTSQWIID